MTPRSSALFAVLRDLVPVVNDIQTLNAPFILLAVSTSARRELLRMWLQIGGRIFGNMQISFSETSQAFATPRRA